MLLSAFWIIFVVACSCGPSRSEVCLTDETKYDLATKALLSPVVFHGTVLTVFEERGGTRIRATFGLQKLYKMEGELKRGSELEVVYLQSSRERTGVCVVMVNEDVLQPGQQYIVFAVAVQKSSSFGHSVFQALSIPVPYTKRSNRKVKKVLCKNCATAPSVRGLTNVKVVERRRFRLQCRLSGNPAPSVEWLKEGKKIESKRRVQVRTKRKYSRLVFKQARLYDNGEYECRATNAVGQNSLKALVTVTKKTKKPRPTSKPSNTSHFWIPDGVPCPKPDFCLNGGSCIYLPSLGEYSCQCASGFMGHRCEQKVVSLPLLEREHHHILVIVVIIGVLFLLSNLTLIVYVVYRRLHGSSQHEFKREPSEDDICIEEKASFRNQTKRRVSFRVTKPKPLPQDSTQSERPDRIVDGKSDSEEGSELSHLPCNMAPPIIRRPRLNGTSSDMFTKL